MPYKVEKCPDHDDCWNTVNEDTGDVKAHHETKDAAERQVRLLDMIEHGDDNGSE